MLNREAYELAENFVPTAMFKKIEDNFNQVRRTGLNLHIVGRAGTGKTTALRKLAAEMSGCLYVQAAPHINTPSAILRAIEADLPGCSGKQQLQEVANDVTQAMGPFYDDVFKQHRFVLIIDEVQQLAATAIRSVLDITERSRAGLIIAGNHEELADRGKVSPEALEQIKTRIWGRFETDDALKRVDVERIANAYGVDTMDAYAFCVEFAEHNTIRDLAHLLTAARGWTLPGKAIQKSELVMAAMSAGRKPMASGKKPLNSLAGDRMALISHERKSA